MTRGKLLGMIVIIFIVVFGAIFLLSTKDGGKVDKAKASEILNYVKNTDKQIDISSLLSDYECVTFMSQEYGENSWTLYNVFFTHSRPSQMYNKVSDGSYYEYLLPVPNVSIFVQLSKGGVIDILTSSSPSVSVTSFSVPRVAIFASKDLK